MVLKGFQVCFRKLFRKIKKILALIGDVLPDFPFTASETCAIITYKHGIYELPHGLPNDLRLRILGNFEISENCLNFIE